MSTGWISRRKFLSLLAAAGALLPWPGAGRTVAAAAPTRGTKSEPRVGIALGAGGAAGLAHILMLEALDELGVRPRLVTGSSIGAVIGALYCSSLPAKEIRGLVDELVVSDGEDWTAELLSEEALRLFDFIDPEMGRGGLIRGEGFLRFLYEKIGKDRFEELAIPLKVVAAEFWDRRERVFSSGDLLPAVRASMALPGLISPVRFGGRVLVDGGLVNPVPFDLLFADCDVTVAIDVSGIRTPGDTPVPSYLETVFNSFKIMQQAILTGKLDRRRPDIYLKPQIKDVLALEFYRSEDIYRQAEPAKEELKRQLAARLS